MSKAQPTIFDPSKTDLYFHAFDNHIGSPIDRKGHENAIILSSVPYFNRLFFKRCSRGRTPILFRTISISVFFYRHINQIKIKRFGNAEETNYFDSASKTICFFFVVPAHFRRSYQLEVSSVNLNIQTLYFNGVLWEQNYFSVQLIIAKI